MVRVIPFLRRACPPALQRCRRACRLVFWEHGGLTGVVLLAAYTRVWLLRWWSPFPFGDVSNFISIAQQLAQGTYSVTEKRLPFYPFLLLLGHTIVPTAAWETIAIAIAILMSLLCLVLFYAIGRTLAIRKTALVIGLLFLASYPPFLAYSIRGYADTTFLALLLAAILAVLLVPRRWAVFGGAVFLGFLPLTRYEGVVAALPLGLMLLWKIRKQPKMIVLVFLIGVLVLTPYVVIALRSGRSLLPQTYLAQGARVEKGGYGTTSFREFAKNYGTIWDRLKLFALWQTPRALGRSAITDTLGFHNAALETVAQPRSAAALLGILGWMLLLFRRRLRDVLTLVLPFLTVAIPIAWWSPQIRYDAFFFPLIAFTAAAGVHGLGVLFSRATTGQRGMFVRRGCAVILVVIAAVIWMGTFTHETRDNIRKSQYRKFAYYQALRLVKTMGGTVLFDVREGLTTATLRDRVIYTDDLFKGTHDAAERWMRLKDHRVETAVTDILNDRQSPLAFLTEKNPIGTATEIARLFVEQGDHDTDTAIVYRITFSP